MWQVTVGGTVTNAVPFASLSYTVPAVTALSLTTGASAKGGETVTITGTSFGSTDIDVDQFGNAWPILTYGNDGAPLTPTGCHTVSQTSIICITSPGVGSGYRWTVTVDKQTSAPFGSTSYLPPSVVTSVFVADANSNVDISIFPGRTPLARLRRRCWEQLWV